MKISISFAIAALYAATATAAPIDGADHVQVQTGGDNVSDRGAYGSIPISALNGPINIVGAQESSHKTSMDQHQSGHGSTKQVQKGGSSGYDASAKGDIPISALNGPINAIGVQEEHSESDFHQEAKGHGSKTQVQKGGDEGYDASAKGSLPISTLNGPINTTGVQKSDSKASYSQDASGKGEKVQVQKGGASGYDASAKGDLMGISAVNGPVNAIGVQEAERNDSFDQHASGKGSSLQKQAGGRTGYDAAAKGDLALTTLDGPINTIGVQKSKSGDQMHQEVSGKDHDDDHDDDHDHDSHDSHDYQDHKDKRTGTYVPVDSGYHGAYGSGDSGYHGAYGSGDSGYHGAYGSGDSSPIETTGAHGGHSSSGWDYESNGKGKTHQTQEIGGDGIKAPAKGAIALTTLDSPINTLGAQEGISKKCLNQSAGGKGSKYQHQKVGGSGVDASADGELLGTTAIDGPINAVGYQKGESEACLNQEGY